MILRHWTAVRRARSATLLVERAVERLLTVTRTCQLQQLNTLVYLTAAIRCHRRRQAVASLLPKRQTP
jgi:hypothetical protein